MATIEQIKDYKICNIIEVTLGGILLELHLNLKHLDSEKSISILASDVGETLLFSIGNYWKDKNNIKYEAYTIQRIGSNSSLSKLIGDKITNIEFGIGKTLYTEEQVIYYIMLQTNDSKCLFFNNGDECAYSLDKINKILADDIYGYKWEEIPSYLI
ncbi:hypothetical protein OL230_05715 [Capnocytophaga ochracea]|jgi:hypothetical protein|uniref:hypothetical protein n=1 Tax=Capnocytophaga ochracea TaxID=1018 RepID=UPI002230E73E|nr:hypothetical protein [Capnocytophaga ochracea]UZD37501.1 hypothetical protein OL230_06435 [Capnocytophaga ochracea]UZD39658.1 hypothetical protein OL230_05715 [Capnocytophaga ochracea]